ncbi:hypothetical protein L484_004520 [Morus notabilis]|uniref:Uncharacterized protein n=1 Tax=Morus notabilis TaxID=981085 RepID=W9QJT0_9ROSA|nr:hypothetical protein L484_004520 [Morus notabilis]
MRSYLSRNSLRNEVPEVHDKYRQSPILQRKLSEVLQIQNMERCLEPPRQALPPNLE